MAYFVDRVVVCDAYNEPNQHYELLRGGKSRLIPGRRPSKRILALAKDVKGGVAGVIGRETSLFEDMLASEEQNNEFVNSLRGEIRAWRESGYPGTALVTRRLLEWWFERDEERKATGKRLFFCQREAIETVIFLYELQGARRMPETGDLVRYALKLATGTGKTIVMALLVAWSTLHKQKVSGSSLSSNFLVLVPNLTVRDRVSGTVRGDGLDPSGAENLYDAFDVVPPEYRTEFQPTIVVRNWQSIPLEAKRDDWLPEDVAAEGRFVPASVLLAMQRRAGQDPATILRRVLGNWRDVVVINDEAHHVYGEKRGRTGEDPEHIKWSKILDLVSKAAKISLVLDLSATPWYGSGSPKPEGTLFEWLVSDFSVYDAFESGLVKVVRLPDPTEQAAKYLDLWDAVKDARTKEEYLSACKGAIASIYSGWKQEFEDWSSSFEFARGPSPVLLLVASDATRAGWLFEHLTKDYDLLRNSDTEDRTKWVTVQVDSKIFNAQQGSEAILREMVSTVGKSGRSGQYIRAIVSVNMLSEGWDVKSVTHILGLRAFGSPLLTEQIIGRGLRRTNYDILNQPLEERPDGSEETVDAFGIPFVGFPVERRKRPRAGQWGQKPIWIEKDSDKATFRIQLPNVRSWAVGVSEPLSTVIRVGELSELRINPKETPPDTRWKPVVGGKPETVSTLAQFREEYPILKSSMLIASELLELTSPRGSEDLGIGPTFDELLEVVTTYFKKRLKVILPSDPRDVGIYFWRQQVLNVLSTAIRGGASAGLQPVPILGTPDILDTETLRRFQWTGIVGDGKKCHTNKVPCHTDLEKGFSTFLDSARDVIKYFKNERFGFSITYYENNRPRQYYPDFIVVVRGDDGGELHWLAETKGEVRHNTNLKRQAADLWCEKISTTKYGPWRHLFVPQRDFERAIRAGTKSFGGLVGALRAPRTSPQIDILQPNDPHVPKQAFKTHLPIYSLKAAAGYFGAGQAVEPEGWIDASEIGRLEANMFVARALGNSMIPRIQDQDLLVFRSKPEGSRSGKIVLAQYRGPADPETGGSFTVKRYRSEKSAQDGDTWQHSQIALEPLNPEYKSIVLKPQDSADFSIIAEYIATLRRPTPTQLGL